MNENAIFIIHQDHCNVKHPFNLQANNIGGTFTRKDQVRFYEAVRNDIEKISLFLEVHVEKVNGKGICGKINSKVSGRWEQREANLNNVYVVVRKRAEHKMSKESGASLVRYLIFATTLEEHNSKHSSMSKLKCFTLNHELISKQFFHLHMSVKYGILKKQMLTILEEQLIVSNGKNYFKI